MRRRPGRGARAGRWGAGSVVTRRRAQVVLLSAQGVDAALPLPAQPLPGRGRQRRDRLHPDRLLMAEPRRGPVHRLASLPLRRHRPSRPQGPRRRVLPLRRSRHPAEHAHRRYSLARRRHSRQRRLTPYEGGAPKSSGRTPPCRARQRRNRAARSPSGRPRSRRRGRSGSASPFPCRTPPSGSRAPGPPYPAGTPSRRRVRPAASQHGGPRPSADHPRRLPCDAPAGEGASHAPYAAVHRPAAVRRVTAGPGSGRRVRRRGHRRVRR